MDRVMNKAILENIDGIEMHGYMYMNYLSYMLKAITGKKLVVEEVHSELF